MTSLETSLQDSDAPCGGQERNPCPRQGKTKTHGRRCSILQHGDKSIADQGRARNFRVPSRPTTAPTVIRKDILTRRAWRPRPRRRFLHSVKIARRDGGNGVPSITRGGSLRAAHGADGPGTMTKSIPDETIERLAPRFTPPPWGPPPTRLTAFPAWASNRGRRGTPSTRMFSRAAV